MAGETEKWREEVDRRLLEHDGRLDDHRDRLDRGNKRMTDLTSEIARNTEVTERTEKNTAELLELFGAIKGFVKVSGWVGRGILAAAALLVAMGVIWWALEDRSLPREAPMILHERR